MKKAHPTSFKYVQKRISISEQRIIFEELLRYLRVKEIKDWEVDKSIAENLNIFLLWTPDKIRKESRRRELEAEALIKRIGDIAIARVKELEKNDNQEKTCAKTTKKS